jgi:hypothetical protein
MTLTVSDGNHSHSHDGMTAQAAITCSGVPRYQLLLLLLP